MRRPRSRRPTDASATVDLEHDGNDVDDRDGGRYEVPEPEDVVACEQALAGDGEFIFDVHTHHVVPDGPWRQNARRIADMILGLVPAGCAEADPYRCLDRVAYLHDMFLASDTTVALLSDVPNSGPLDAPLPWEAKRETQAARRLARRRRRSRGAAPRRDRPELRRPVDAPRRDGGDSRHRRRWPRSRCTRRGARAGRATPSTTRPSASPWSSRPARSACR